MNEQPINPSPLELLTRTTEAPIASSSEELDRAINILVDAQKQRYQRDTAPSDHAELFSALGARLLQPTRTGRFGEAIGNAAEVIPAYAAAQKQKRREAEEGLLDTALSAAKMRYERAGQRESDALSRQEKMLDLRVKLAQSGLTVDAEGNIVADPSLGGMGVQVIDHPQLGKVVINRKTGSISPLAKFTNPDSGDAFSVTPEQANEVGVPIDVPDIFRNISGDPKARDRMAIQARTKAQTKLDKLDQNVAGKQSQIENLQRFLQLNEQGYSSPYYSGDFVKGAAKILGSPELREMDTYASQIVPTMRQPGSGATSDFDAKMFQSATIGVDKDPATNKNIGTAMLLQSQRELEHQEFMNDYFGIHGHLEGADRKWREYVNKNPIFDPRSNKRKLNNNRKTYKDFFRETNLKKLERKTTEPQSDAYKRLKSKGYSDAKIKRFLQLEGGQ